MSKKPERVQCPQCRRWFDEGRQEGHRCFYHDESRQQLQQRVEELARDLGRTLPVAVALRLEPVALEKMSEAQLVRWCRYLEERRQLASQPASYFWELA